jgi:hypothetical protein
MLYVDQPGSRVYKELQIKMRRTMPFGEVSASLKAKFKKTEEHHLRLEIPQQRGPVEWRILFDSDTPASVCSPVIMQPYSYTDLDQFGLNTEDAEKSRNARAGCQRPRIAVWPANFIETNRHIEVDRTTKIIEVVVRDSQWSLWKERWSTERLERHGQCFCPHADASSQCQYFCPYIKKLCADVIK